MFSSAASPGRADGKMLGRRRGGRRVLRLRSGRRLGQDDGRRSRRRLREGCSTTEVFRCAEASKHCEGCLQRRRSRQQSVVHADVTGLHESPGDRGRAQRAHTASSTGNHDESASDRTCKQRPKLERDESSMPGLADERWQKLIKNDPLIMPAQLA